MVAKIARSFVLGQEEKSGGRFQRRARSSEFVVIWSWAIVRMHHLLARRSEIGIVADGASGRSDRLHLAAPEAMLRWIRKTSTGTDLTMSVCVGSFVLARTGLLDGKSATTHHDAYAEFAKQLPKVHVARGVRFVDESNLATSGGLAAGIDLAMNVIETQNNSFSRNLEVSRAEPGN
jgi:transcriptional regulator GlxA family with amidase domain